jgi:hypothetical protein
MTHLLLAQVASSGQRRWLFAALVLLAIIAATALCSWFLVRRRHAPAPAAETLPPRLAQLAAVLAGFLAVAIVAVGLTLRAGRTPEPAVAPEESLLDQPFGAQPLSEVADEGFHAPEKSAQWGDGYRWTNGAAKMLIPLRGSPPRSVHVHLILPGRPGIRLRILANGQSLYDETNDVQGGWSRTFDLSGVKLGSELALEILSDTFSPAKKYKANTDQRILGVRLVAVTLVSGTRSFTDVPIEPWALPEVAQTGLYPVERVDGALSQWTNGDAAITVPVRGPRPQALALALHFPNQPDFQIEVAVNGTKVFDELFQPGADTNGRFGRDISIVLPLTAVDLGDSAQIALRSSTCVPATISKDSTDNRKLGVRVKRLMLVSDTAAPKP